MSINKASLLFFPFLLMIFLSLSSCKLFLKASGNYYKPGYEAPSSVIAYLKKQDAKYDGVYICTDKKSMKYVVDSIENTLPTVFVFDKEFTKLYQDAKCPWSSTAELDSLTSSSSWKKDNDLKLKKLIKQLIIIDGSGIENLNKLKYDFYIFYSWAKFVPKLSNEMIKQINKFRNNTHTNIYIGSINLDLQENWK